MSFDILIVIVITSFIQSIFGVGVLLFGTPLLLLQGYSFIDAVIILLPISLSINIIQIAKDFRSVDLDFYKKILLYSIPFVVIFLFVVTRLEINIGIIIGLFLLFVAAKNFSLRINNIIKSLVRYEKVYFMIMGVVHGLTNLGGSLLTAIVHSREYDKQVTRVTIAISYATFAIFQIITLVISGHSFNNRISGIGIYLIVGITIFVLTEKIVYKDINNENYSKGFATFLLISGILLCVKSI
jgi:uncharacterized membrane protein YfcA